MNPSSGRGPGKERSPARRNALLWRLQPQKRVGGGSILIKQQKGEKGVRRVEAASLGPVGKKEGMGAGGGAG